MSVCYIVGAGAFYGELLPSDGDLVIAADGGYDALLSRGIRCDLVIGDMDSLASESISTERLLFPPEKDFTDTALAYFEGVKRGYSVFRLYGCVGGREDHTFANYCLICDAKDAGNDVTMVGNGYEIFALKNEKTVKKRDTGATISIFAFGGEARGVSLSGLKYELSDYTLSPLVALGVSNEFVGRDAVIEVKDGRLLVMIETR